MRSHIYYFLIFKISLIFFISDLHAQIIRGEVIDSETKEPVPFANVYYNASIKGTTTNSVGKFELSQNGYEGQSVVVSFMGYESLIIENCDPTNYYKVLLSPSTNMLSEIIVRPDDWPLKKKRRIFIREFLGTSNNSKHCEIENLDDIILVYIKETRTLEAYCYKPIIIHNHSLNYKIRYFMQEFKWQESNISYQGNFIFELDSCKASQDLGKVDERRADSYHGSMMHFFRKLYEGSYQDAGFDISMDGKEFVVDEFVIIAEETEQSKYLNTGMDIYIEYAGKFSNISFKGEENLFFKKNGYFDPRFITWSGAMTKLRMADLLPYEYWPQQ